MSTGRADRGPIVRAVAVLLRTRQDARAASPDIAVRHGPQLVVRSERWLRMWGERKTEDRPCGTC